MGKIELSSSNKYYSHPGKLLSEHLKNVAENSKNIVKSKKFNLDKFISADILQTISYLIGTAHDFGKFTSFFQNYLMEKDEKEKRKFKNKKETRHSFISAIFAFTLIQQYLKEEKLLDCHFYDFLPIISFLVVRRHHGDLRDALNDVIIDEDDLEVFNIQLSTVNIKDVQRIYDSLFEKINFNFNLKNIAETIQNYQRITFQNKQKVRSLGENETLFFYFILLFLYSVLLDSDKTDAAELVKISPHILSPNLVDIYKEEKLGKSKNEINLIRDKIYSEVTRKVYDINLTDDKVFSLNVPTGSGKTLSSFSFALKLRNRIEKEMGYSPKIIYSLPFLSIIEQNFDVVKDVLNDPTTDILLKHHHLSDVYYETKGNDFHYVNEDMNKNLLLIEGWNSEVVFTTFVQFFYSIMTNKNKAARKFHNVTNSIVILDEVQAIPNKFWLLMNNTISFLSEYFNTYFLIMTATQPLIFEKTIELVENKKKYFNSLNRFLLTIKPEEKSLEDFILYLKNDINKFPDKDFLIVLNTIKSSICVYEELKNTVSDDSEIFYLSTNITPFERISRINKIKKKNSKRKITISTQMIEAGVDIDVDIVIRDFAPLDSVNQAAGRCNRNFNNARGIVKLFNLYQDNDKIYFPKKIYDSFLISKVEDVLKDTTKIEEKDFLQLTNEYFKEVEKGKSNEVSRNILKNVQDLNFGRLSEFKLIDNDYPTIDVFVTIDKEAEKIWNSYEEICNNEGLTGFEKRNVFLKIRKKFYDYIISVPEKYAGDFEQGKINYISKEELNAYYDIKTGYKRENPGKGVLSF